MSQLLYVQCQGHDDVPCDEIYPRNAVPALCVECKASPIEALPWDPREDETDARLEDILLSFMIWLEETDAHRDTTGQLHSDYRDGLIMLAECIPQAQYLWQEEETDHA